MKGTVTMGHTYTDSLDHTASRIFWSISAAKGRIVFGADGYNAFAETLPPKDPLYIIVDQQYHDWYRHTNNMSIPEDYGIKVNRALQGHPEYPRVLATLINKHITALDFKPCFHEPYVYYHPNYNGKEVYFLRQVDDFAVSCIDETIVKDVIAYIDQKMTAKIKLMGCIKRFNGVDVTQPSHYIKISTHTYINKILKDTPWVCFTSHTSLIPMNPDNMYNHNLEQLEPLTDHDLKLVEDEYSFSYK